MNTTEQGIIRVAVNEGCLERVLLQMGTVCSVEPKSCSTLEEKIEELYRLRGIFWRTHGGYGIELKFDVSPTGVAGEATLSIHQTPLLLELCAAILKRAEDPMEHIVI